MPTIVLFEDDPDIADLIVIILKGEGYDVQHFNSVEHHKEILKRTKPDLVLMDYMIPGGGGDMATRSIKTDPQLSETKVMIISASTDIEKVTKRSGADGLIRKPFDLYELIETVKNKVAA